MLWDEAAGGEYFMVVAWMVERLIGLPFAAPRPVIDCELRREGRIVAHAHVARARFPGGEKGGFRRSIRRIHSCTAVSRKTRDSSGEETAQKRQPVTFFRLIPA